MFNVKFDLICSIGGSCECAMYLNEIRYRLASAPFDWLTGVTLERNVRTMTERFANFLKRENIVWMESGRGDRANDVLGDRRLHMRVLGRLRLSSSLARARFLFSLRRGFVRFVSLGHFSRDGRKRARSALEVLFLRKGGSRASGW